MCYDFKMWTSKRLSVILQIIEILFACWIGWIFWSMHQGDILFLPELVLAISIALLPLALSIISFIIVIRDRFNSIKLRSVAISTTTILIIAEIILSVFIVGYALYQCHVGSGSDLGSGGTLAWTSGYCHDLGTPPQLFFPSHLAFDFSAWINYGGIVDMIFFALPLAVIPLFAILDLFKKQS